MWIDAIQSPADFAAVLSQMFVATFATAALWSLVSRSVRK
jgi:hypothetical protein